MNSSVDSVKIPCLSVAYVVVEHEGLILRQDSYGVDTGVNAVRQRKVDDSVLASIGYGRLCDILGQRIEP